MKKIIPIPILLVFLLLLSGCNENNLPEPEVNSVLENATYYPDGFYPGEEALIQVSVDGSTINSEDIIAKVDIAFILDRSGSISRTDPDEISKQVVQEMLTTLNPAQHRSNVVIFSDGADFACENITSLSTDFNQLGTCVQNIGGPEGLTNIAESMELANDMLATDGANHRIAILFTDGYPMTNPYVGYDTQQDAYITNALVPEAIENDIVYYVVYLNTDPEIISGSDEEAYVTSLISNICSRTGGHCYTIDDVNQLQGIFENIIEENNNSLFLKNVRMNIDINDAYTPVNTSSYISTGLTYQVNGNTITTAPFARLPENQRISLTFKATAYEPIPPADQTVSTNIPVFTSEAKIYYDLGDGNQLEAAIPQLSIKWLKPPMVLVKKTVEPGSREMKIKVINYIRDAAIKDVSLWEIVANNMEVRLNTCDPIPDNIFSPAYSSNTSFDYIPELLHYKLGDLETFESAEVKFNFNYFGPTQGSVTTDMSKPSASLFYTSPNGTREELQFVVQSSDINEIWHGDRTIDAAEYALNEPVALPDFDIYAAAFIAQNEYEFDLPVASSYHIWNDSQHNGWLESAGAEHFTSPDPFYIGNKNRVWFHINQYGNADPDSDLTVKIYLKDKFDFKYSDYGEEDCIFLGEKEFTTDSDQIIDFIEFNPQTVLTQDQWIHFSGLDKAWYKLVIDYPGDELRKNNNIAFKEILISNQ